MTNKNLCVWLYARTYVCICMIRSCLLFY